MDFNDVRDLWKDSSFASNLSFYSQLASDFIKNPTDGLLDETPIYVLWTTLRQTLQGLIVHGHPIESVGKGYVEIIGDWRGKRDRLERHANWALKTLDDPIFRRELYLAADDALGNHKPEIRNVDKAFRRRIQMVPFTVTPARVDNELGAKLRAEWPAILAWMIEGCLAWQQQGLNPPERVLAATAEYLDGEDAVGKWVEDCIEPAEGVNVTLHELFVSFTEWANECGEHRGTQKRLSSALMTRGWEKWKEPKTRRAGFQNVKIVHRQDPLLP